MLAKQFDYGILIALIIPLFALMPLALYQGLPNTADGPIHLMRQVEFNQAWTEGNYYPRWGFDLAFGHGMPIFNYAPPALYFLTQFFHLLTLPLDTAMKTVVVLDICLYSLGMYLFLRRIFGTYPALIAAAIHVYAPYRLREIYIQGNYGQLTGLACYPLILWAFHGLITTRHRHYLIAAPLTLALLLLSHNISAMLFAPLFAAYLIFLLTLEFKNQPSQALKSLGLTCLAALLGLGLAAIFWLPAFGERHDIKLEGITRDFFDFRENFISLDELLALPKPLDRAAINPEFPLSLGLAQIVAITFSIFVLLMWLLKPLPSPYNYPLAHSLFFLAALLFYSFLTIPPSQFFWETIPLLELTEFPWRMLGPALCCGSIVAAIAPYYALQTLQTQKFHQVILAVGVMGPIFINLYYLYPAQFITWGSPSPRQVFQYEMTTGAIGTTSTGEFLPRTAQQHPNPQTLWPDYEANRPAQRFEVVPPQANIKRLYRQAEAESWSINTPHPFSATLRLLYWPGWNFYLNHQPIPYTIITPTGLVQFSLPAGEHTLTMQLESTPLRTWGKWLSLFSFLGLIFLVIIPVSPIVTLRPPFPPLQSSLFIQIFLLLGVSYGLTRLLEPLFTLQSDPDLPQLADYPAQADFGNQIRLVGFDNLSHEIIQSGETLKIVLYWRALRNLETNYSVFVHLDAPDGQTYATVDEPDPEFIPSRNWPPSLYLRHVLKLPIPPDLAPIRYTVNVGVYQQATGTRLTLPNSTDYYTIGHIWHASPPPPTLPPHPLASFEEQVQLRQVTFNDQQLTLYWQTNQVLTSSNTIFIHLLDEQGHLIEQLDGVPYQDNYPLASWRVGEIIQDRRKPTVRPHQILIGLYNPTTGQRLSARDPQNQPLLNDSYSFTVTP